MLREEATILFVYCVSIAAFAVASTPAEPLPPAGYTGVMVVGWESCAPCESLHREWRRLPNKMQKKWSWCEVGKNSQHRVTNYPLVMHVVNGKLKAYGKIKGAQGITRKQMEFERKQME